MNRSYTAIYQLKELHKTRWTKRRIRRMRTLKPRSSLVYARSSPTIARDFKNGPDAHILEE